MATRLMALLLAVSLSNYFRTWCSKEACSLVEFVCPTEGGSLIVTSTRRSDADTIRRPDNLRELALRPMRDIGEELYEAGLRGSPPLHCSSAVFRGQPSDPDSAACR